MRGVSNFLEILQKVRHRLFADSNICTKKKLNINDYVPKSWARHTPITGSDGCSEVVVDVLEAQRFVRDVYIALGVSEQSADEMADVLIAADYMGQPSRGIYRLPGIVSDLLNSSVDPRMKPSVICEREAMALVDGQNSPGPVVANFCMDLAVHKARNQAIGFVAARHSNWIGMPSWYTCQALAQRMIGLCMTNGKAILVPSGGIEPILGDNSVACSASSTKDQLLVDIGLSAYSIERLEWEYSRGCLQPLPNKMALDSHGQPTDRVETALLGRRMRPFEPEYKGFGLAAMVDILCGVMTGARYASRGRKDDLTKNKQDIADLGQVFIAIDPMRYSVCFEERQADFHQVLRNILPCNTIPLIPGDKENEHMNIVDERGGISLPSDTFNMLMELGKLYSLKLLEVK